VLAETGLVGLVAFLWLVWSVGRHALDVHASRGDPEERGLVLGFLAGFVGLLVHAFGSNTFIIVRIMEPFWLLAGLIVVLSRSQGTPGAQEVFKPFAMGDVRETHGRIG
jgi:O-antigen ligase